MVEWKNINKKQQQNLLRLGLLAVLGVALLLVGGRGEPHITQQGQTDVQADTNKVAALSSADVVQRLESKLAQTLAQVQGAGTVTVQITVNDLGRKEYARDLQRTERSTNEENGDSKQHISEVQETQTVVQQQGSQTGGALLVEETMPEICGVLIVASGAAQATVQEELLQAAATVLQLSADKIMVLPGEGGAANE